MNQTLYKQTSYDARIVKSLEEKLQMAIILHSVLEECSLHKAIVLAPSIIELFSRFNEDGIDIGNIKSSFLCASGIMHIDELYGAIPEIIKKWKTILKQKAWQDSAEYKPYSIGPISKFRIDDYSNLKGIEYLECKSLREEAICSLLRTKEILKTPGKKVAIISDSAALIKMILSISKLFDIDVANCFGTALQETVQIDFIRLIFETVRQNFSPSLLLALLRHSMFSLTKDRFDLDALIVTLESQYMRGIRKYADLGSLIDLVSDRELKIFLWLLQEEFKSLVSVMSQESADFVFILKELSSAAIRISTFGKNAIYYELSRITLEDVMVQPHYFLKLFDLLIANETFEQAPDTNAMVKIFSLANASIEGDHIILTCMNEESFFKNRSYDHNLIKGIYKILNITSYDRDFFKAEQTFIDLVKKGDLLITRSSMVDGAPQTPSYLLIKLELLAKKFEVKGFYNKDLLNEARSIYIPIKFIEPSLPAPIPPGGDRLQKLSVTQIVKLLKDPYSIYSSHILNLHKLEAVDKALDKLDFGKFIHGIMDRFARDYTLKKSKEEHFKNIMSYGQIEAAKMIQFPVVKAIWLTQLQNLANWMIKFEETKREVNIKIYTEKKGEVKLQLENGAEFTLTCKADRIEISDNGSATIIDFKTGSLPSKSDILSGSAPQLTLEAWILLANGFNEIAGSSLSIDDLSYISLATGKNFGNITSLKESLRSVIEETVKGLKNLILIYNNPTTPFLICPTSEDSSSNNAHAHLERIEEL